MNSLNIPAEKWLQSVFEHRDCEECGRGAEGHIAVPHQGEWRARCKVEGSIYQEMIEARIPVDSHCSDLYAKVTLVSEEIIARYPFKKNVRRFRSNLDGTQWFVIPFAFDPYWENKKAKAVPAE